MNEKKTLFQESYYSLYPAYELRAELVEKRSRFIATLFRVNSRDDAAAFIERIRKRERDARHNVFAWRLSSGEQLFSDDGEPSYTAGAPLLDFLEAENLSDICCVVSRYFGGILLGTGGLVRAYTKVAQSALQQAQKEDRLQLMQLFVPISCTFSYEAYGRIVRLVADAQGHIAKSTFSDAVDLVIEVFPKNKEALMQAIDDELRHKNSCKVGKPHFIAK